MIELGSILILGVFAQWLAWRLKIPAILPLILIGLAVGPFADWYLGHKLIDPIFDPETGKGLFPSSSLFYFVSLAIGIILFEGGLTLKKSEIRGVEKAILNLITVGSLVTFIGGALAAHFILDLSWEISCLFAALIIVTGPTVIAPILRNTPLNQNVATVLKWEGILIDPIGALAAVLVYEFIIAGHVSSSFGIHAFAQFLKICCIGFTIGVTGAMFFRFMLSSKSVPHYLLNVVTLGMVLLVFVASDWLEHESGLLAVVVMGMVLGNIKIPHFKEILYFKESLTVLLISILFIVLSAKMEVSELMLLGKNSLIIFAIVVLILRPIAVFLSTGRSDLSFKEKLFISWVGPRGIVAAGIASLFGLKLVKVGVPGAEMITPLVFMVVLGTVLLNATTASMVASILGVRLTKSEGVLIVGAHTGARLLARWLTDKGRHVVMMDNSETMVRAANEEGLTALQHNIYQEIDTGSNVELMDVGYLVAMTGSDEVNQFAADKYQDQFGENGTFRLMTRQELLNSELSVNNKAVFSPTTDYINFSEVARDFPQIHEVEVANKEELTSLIAEVDASRDTVPIFIQAADSYYFVPATRKEGEFRAGEKLIFMGNIDSIKSLSAS